METFFAGYQDGFPGSCQLADVQLPACVQASQTSECVKICWPIDLYIYMYSVYVFLFLRYTVTQYICMYLYTHRLYYIVIVAVYGRTCRLQLVQIFQEMLFFSEQMKCNQCIYIYFYLYTMRVSQDKWSRCRVSTGLCAFWGTYGCMTAIAAEVTCT